MTAQEILAYAQFLPQDQRNKYLADVAALTSSVQQSAVNTADLSTGSTNRKVAIADTEVLRDAQFEVIFDNSTGTTSIDVVVFDAIGKFDDPSYTKPTGGTFNGKTARWVSLYTAYRNIVISKIEIESLTKQSLGTMVKEWKYCQARLDENRDDFQPIRFSFPTNQDPNLVLTGTYVSDNLVFNGISSFIGKVAAGDIVTLRFYVSAIQRAFIGNA